MKRGGPLKRSELKRGTTQLKRSNMPRATKPMRQVSKKKAKQSRTFQPQRNAFKAELGCPCGRIASDCHEIWGGGVRFITCELREFWIAACRPHHEEIQGWVGAKRAWQYALKQIVDNAYYSLEKLNEYATGRVSEAEVVSAKAQVEQWLREIKR